MKFLKQLVWTIIVLFIFYPVNAENNVAYLDISLMMSKSLGGQSIQKQLETKLKKIYSKLNPWQKTLLARAENRPKSKYFIDSL